MARHLRLDVRPHVHAGGDRLVGHEHPGGERLELGHLLGRGVLGRRPERALADRLEGLVHPRPERGGHGLLVELGRRPGSEPAPVPGRTRASVLGRELLGVPGRVARPGEGADRDLVGPDVVRVSVATEVVVGGDDVGPVAADQPGEPADRLVQVGLPEASAGRDCRVDPSCPSRGSRGSPTRSPRGPPSPARARRHAARRGGGGSPECPSRRRRSRPSRPGCRSPGRPGARRRRSVP